MTRSRWLCVTGGILCALAVFAGTSLTSGEPVGKPEKTRIRIGLPVPDIGFLPLYLVADRTAREEGLSVEVVAFGGQPAATQALASDSVDIIQASLNAVINLVTAGHRVKAFYGGSYPPDFEWFARPEIKRWEQLRGRSLAISAHGALTDLLTRYVLRKHGLEPGRDVQLVPGGGQSSRFQALKAGRVDAAILTAPFRWAAEADGLSRLGTEATEVAEEWPKGLFIAKEVFLETHPNTVRALLRAHVRAVRLARAAREPAVETLISWLKYERPYAERAYDEVVRALSERGGLPVAGMPVFWQVAIAMEEAKEPWPESRFLDRRFIDTFDEWAPR